jgi:DNA-binding MarR family transcriptional regulator
VHNCSMTKAHNHPALHSSSLCPEAPSGSAKDQQTMTHHNALMEQLFFGYRAFVCGPDETLKAYDFGRAHHRALYFIARHRGLKVGELLEILQITKQSLARVLKQLIAKNMIVQEPGKSDKRERCLYLTPEGEALISTLMDMQRQHLARALQSLSPDQKDGVFLFLQALDKMQ